MATHSSTNMSQPILHLQGVHYHVALQDSELSIIEACDLTVQPQESVAIVGRSGSGKSTLLSLMAGLEQASEGEVRLLSQPLQSLSEDQRAQIRAQQVGFIFQNFQLMPTLSALENVLMPLELFQMPNALARAQAALDQVGLSERYHHRPSELSGGEQQRVAIARAFVTEPKILFADEPTGNLDEETAQQIQSLLFELNQQHHTTLILVTHDPVFAQHCHRTLQLQQGRLVPLQQG